MLFHTIFIVIIIPISSIALDLNAVKLSIDYFNYRNVTLICLLNCRQNIFWSTAFCKEAFKNSMMVSGVSLDKVNYNFSSVKQCIEYDSQAVGIVINEDCEGIDHVMHFASETQLFTAQHKWLIIRNNETVLELNNYRIDKVVNMENDTVMATLSRLNLSVDADIIVGVRENSGYYNLYEVFNFGKIQGGNLIVNWIGYYDDENRVSSNLDLNEYKYYRRWDFQNWTMRMVLVANPVPKEFDISRFMEAWPIPGFANILHTSGAILYIIGQMHNIRYAITYSDRWISKFDGPVKSAGNSMYLKETDITPVLRYISGVHEKLDLLAPTTVHIETRYYYRIPTKGTGKFENKFLIPFHRKAWWGIIGLLGLCFLILVMCAYIENRPSLTQYATFSVIASICQQFFEDADEPIRGVENLQARKIAILVTGLSSLLIFNYYTSSVVSWLLNGPPPSINSLNELIESPLHLIYDDVGYSRSWLQTTGYYFNRKNANAEDELRQKKIFNKKKNAPLIVPLIEGIKMVQEGGYAFHTEVDDANRLISRTFDQSELCELGSLSSMEKTAIHPSMPKNSPYKEFMTWSLMRLQERGIASCIRSRRTANQARCLGSSPRALALGGAAPAFILLLGGYLLGVLIMLCERLMYNVNKKMTSSFK